MKGDSEQREEATVCNIWHPWNQMKRLHNMTFVQSWLPQQNDCYVGTSQQTGSMANSHAVKSCTQSVWCTLHTLCGCI